MSHPRWIANALALATLLAAATVLSFTPISLVGEARAMDGEEIHDVEGDVQEPVRLSGPPPAYPASEKEARRQGKVVAEVVIGKDGLVRDSRIADSEVGEPFDSAVLEALRQWVFEPATLDGEPVNVRYHLTVNFRLEPNPKNDGSTS